jgi:hypothetical protein
MQRLVTKIMVGPQFDGGGVVGIEVNQLMQNAFV